MEFKQLNQLGWWNLYFAIKLLLYFRGQLEFHVLENLGLALLLLLQIESRPWQRLRQGLAALIALALLYMDAGAPALGEPTALLSPPWPHALLATALLIIAYTYLTKFLELSVFVFAAILVVSLQKAGLPSLLQPLTAGLTPTPVEDRPQTPATAALSNTAINDYLTQFFAAERQRDTDYGSAPAQPFDIVLLSICSLAWDDIKLAGLEQHPLLTEFDLYFDHFNSATSYSGPAVIRLLKADCGQPPHAELFSNQSYRHCQTFANLAQRGYQHALVMNHDGVFDNFLRQISRHGGINAPLTAQSGIAVAQKSFDGTPILDDGQMLDRWLRQRQQSPADRQIMLYNSVSLHDGNRVVGRKVGTGVESYQYRAKTLLDQLQTFIERLQASNRPTLLLLVPEHGAGLRGDRVQLPGMREIPSPSITHVPVAAKLIGAQRLGPAVHIEKESSYYALSALIQRIFSLDAFAAAGFDPQVLSRDLPVTTPVAQNEGSTVLQLMGRDFVSLDGQNWSPYRGSVN